METNKRVKLSQWDALMLEGLRSFGWSNEELLERVREGNLPVDESIYEFDYQALAAFVAAEPETFNAAVKDGYTIKYNTLRGIYSWLVVALHKEPELLLDEGNESVRATLTADEKNRLESVLSFGWSVREEQEGVPGVYRMEPIQRQP